MSIVRLDKVHAGARGNIESVVVYEDDTYAVAKDNYANGLFVTLGPIDESGYGREVHASSPTTADAANGEILLVHAPELSYSVETPISDFVNEANDVVRAYYLTEGDVFTFTDDLLPDGVAVGDVLVAGKDGALVAYATGEYRYAFEVIENSGNELTMKENAHAVKVVKDYTATAGA